MKHLKIIRIAIVDDDDDDFVLTRNILKEIPGNNYEIEWIPTYAKAVQSLSEKQYEIYLVDYLLGAFSGIDFLKEAKKIHNNTPVIILTGKGNPDIDMEAMELGAADYLIKDHIDVNNLERSIRYSLQQFLATEHIRISESKYRNIFEKSRDVIYVSNIDGIFINLNKSAENLFGYRIEEILQKKVHHLFANPDDRMKFETLLTQDGFVHNFESELFHQSGEKLVCLISVDKFENESEEESYLGIIHDLTDHKKAEQVLINSEKFLATARLARTIAHEVRNPLTNINLALEEVRSALAAHPDSQTYIEIIQRNAARINQLITELLDSAKPAELTFVNRTIKELIRESIMLAEDRITLKNIRLKTDLHAEGMLSIDIEKMKIALLNILINAIEEMESGTGELKLKTHIHKNQCIIQISDNGPGIKPEDLPHLFEPFFSKKSKGMGLGLTASQNIILNHGGAIAVDSKPGKGTSFTISLPLVP